MKSTFLKSFLFLLAIALFSPGCTITTEDDSPIDSSLELDEMDTQGWVYSEIEFKGAGFNADCSNTTVTVSNGGTTQELAVQSCTENSIIAWIPDTMEAGTYDVTLNVDGNSFSSINGNNLELEVRIRPVILSLSSTEFAAGEVIQLTGKYIVNDSTVPQNDPKVWLMATGYTNTVSDIVVNAEGTAATVTISDSISPGEYTFKLTCVEWSNELNITIL